MAFLRLSRVRAVCTYVVLGVVSVRCAAGGADSASPVEAPPLDAGAADARALGHPSGEGGIGAGGAAPDAAEDAGSVADPPDAGDPPTRESASTQGPCAVQSYTEGIAAGADFVSPTLYYPTSCAGPFPGVVVAPGFTETQAAVNQWGTFLASHGFAVMCIDTGASGAANTLIAPSDRAKSLMEGVQSLQAEGMRAGSPLAGKVDTSRMAIMGHSMGGGGTLLAANDHPELKAAIGLTPWNPGVTYPKDTVPTLFFDGTADGLVPPKDAVAEYQSIPDGTQKAYVELDGGSHLVASTPLGGAPSDMLVARIGLSWLEVYVVGDARYQAFIAQDPSMSAWDRKP